MAICEVCSTRITSKTPGLQCGGSCQRFYHGKCAGLSKQLVENFLLPGALWLCPDCRNESKMVSRRISVNTVTLNDSQDEPESPSDLTLRIVQNIQSEMLNLNSKYTEVMESINFCSDKISAFESIVQKVNVRLDIIEKISRENSTLKKEVKELNSKVDILEQKLLSNNIEIQGVPEKPNENIFNIIEKIGEYIECPFVKADIDAVHRIGTRIAGKPKPIIVKFLTNIKRDEFLAAAKVKRHSCNSSSSSSRSSGLLIENISNNLYINECLTTNTKFLLKQTKDMAKLKKYKYVWVRNGCIFARQADASKIIKISSKDDVDKLV